LDAKAVQEQPHVQPEEGEEREMEGFSFRLMQIKCTDNVGPLGKRTLDHLLPPSVVPSRQLVIAVTENHFIVDIRISLVTGEYIGGFSL
jgi:hypothetical protein